MADENDQKTLQDLFRVINEMRGDMNTRFDEAAAERQAMRDVIDSLPTFDQVAALEAQTSGIAPLRKQVHKLEADVGKVISRLDRAYIPAE